MTDSDGHTLTGTTIRYLFAAGWAEHDGSNWAMHVPGAKVAGPGTAARLLNLAVWSLCEQGLIEARQLRPVERERVTVMGGRSFTRIEPAGGSAGLPGLEGALLRSARERASGGPAGPISRRVFADAERGLRVIVLGLALHEKAPWASVATHCRGEARDAGLLEVKGRLFPKPVIVDQAAVEALADRDGAIVAAHAAYTEREADLDAAVAADCAAALNWAYQS